VLTAQGCGQRKGADRWRDPGPPPSLRRPQGAPPGGPSPGPRARGEFRAIFTLTPPPAIPVYEIYIDRIICSRNVVSCKVDSRKSSTDKIQFDTQSDEILYWDKGFFDSRISEAYPEHTQSVTCCCSCRCVTEEKHVERVRSYVCYCSCIARIVIHHKWCPHLDVLL